MGWRNFPWHHLTENYALASINHNTRQINRRWTVFARVRATSEALPGHEHQVVTTGPTPVASPLPAVRTDTTWRTGAALPQRQRLVLDLEDVRRLTVDLRAARLRCGARIVVRSDRDSRVVLTGRGGRQVVDAGTGRTGARVRC